MIRFEKSRGLFGEDVREIEATLMQGDGGAQAWTWRESEGATLDRVVELYALDMTVTEIAAELGINKSNVSRALKRTREGGLIPRKEGHGKALGAVAGATNRRNTQRNSATTPVAGCAP